MCCESGALKTLEFGCPKSLRDACHHVDESNDDEHGAANGRRGSGVGEAGEGHEK